MADEKPPEKKRSKRIYVLWGVALALIALGAALVWWNGRLKEEAKSILASAEARVAALAPEPIPEEDNAALFYAKAFEGLKALGDVRRPDIFDARVDSGEIGIGSPDVAAFLDKYRPVTEQLYRGASKSRCDWRDFGFDPCDGKPQSLLPFVNAASLLCLEARLAGHKGGSAKAVERIGQALHLSRSTAKVGRTLDYMLGLNGEDLALRAAMHTVNEAGIDEASLAVLLRLLAEHEKNRPPLTRALEMEHAVTMTFATRALLGLWKVPLESVPSTLREIVPRPSKYSRFHWITGGVIRDARTSDRLIERVLAAADAPYPKALEQLKALSEEPEFAADVKGLKLPYVLTRESWYGCAKVDAASLTFLRAARTAFGCRLYQMRQGRRPATLQEMVKALPEHFSRIPDDPIAGKPLLYRRTKTGFVVYGVGQYDPGDDGGKMAFVSLYDPDIVYPIDPPAYKAFVQQQKASHLRWLLQRKRRKAAADALKKTRDAKKPEYGRGAE